MNLLNIGTFFETEYINNPPEYTKYILLIRWKTAIFLHRTQEKALIFLLSIVDYASLLSQKSSLASSVPPTTTASATGRLYFRKKTLTYSFVSSPDFGKAKLLTFSDTDGNIVEEFPLGVCCMYNLLFRYAACRWRS